MKPRKTRRKVIDVNTDAIIRQTTRQKPAAYRQCGGGVRDEKGAMARQTTVKTLPRTVSVAGGGETKKGELKENTGAKTRKTKVKTLPQATIVAGGGETQGENQHGIERWHNPQSREGGQVPS